MIFGSNLNVGRRRTDNQVSVGIRREIERIAVGSARSRRFEPAFGHQHLPSEALPHLDEGVEVFSGLARGNIDPPLLDDDVKRPVPDCVVVDARQNSPIAKQSAGSLRMLTGQRGIARSLSQSIGRISDNRLTRKRFGQISVY